MRVGIYVAFGGHRCPWLWREWARIFRMQHEVVAFGGVIIDGVPKRFCEAGRFPQPPGRKEIGA